jgi:hypothetical protein
MKTRRVLLLLVGVVVLFSACSKDSSHIQAPAKQDAADTVRFPHSMKGWELYSRPSGNSWKYSVLEGTNRLKSYEEVTTNAIAVTGVDSLKRVLNKLLANEFITWIGPGWLHACWSEDPKDLSLPPQEILDDIRGYCAARQVTLQIAE